MSLTNIVYKDQIERSLAALNVIAYTTSGKLVIKSEFDSHSDVYEVV